MAIVKDWTLAAAEELARGFSFGGGRDSYITDEQRQNVAKNYRDVIVKHCPFEQDVAYAPVKDQVVVALQALKNYGADVECGACMEVAFNGATTSAHTCERPEPPLLQCVDCRNTESPAGAMARMFNHGRCVHCGGYFKVIRA